MIIRALLVACCVLWLAGAASAEPISLDAYRRGLVEVRESVDAARGRGGSPRADAVARAIARLEGLVEVRVDGTIYTAPPHGPLRALLRAGDDASLGQASEMLAEMIWSLERALRPARGRDPAQARRLLDSVLSSTDFRRQLDWRDVVATLLRDWLGGLLVDLPRPALRLEHVAAGAGAVALLLLGFIAAVAGRGLRERVGWEARLPGELEPKRTTAHDYLVAAEDAARAGRLREAVRALFLFSLHALQERGAIRYDPALTDREVLLRAAGLPSAGDLESLVGVYERSWYGLREPTPAEVARARELARRIAR